MDTKSRSAMLAEKAQSSKSSLRESAFSHGSTPVWYKWQPTGPFVLLHLISNKQEQMRLSFTLEERNLTSAHKQPIDNWARIEERLELCEKVDPRLRWYWLHPNGFLLYFPYLEVGKLCKSYYCMHSSFLEFDVWVTSLTTNDVACVIVIGWKQQRDECDPWPRNHQMPKKFPLQLSLSLTGLQVFILSTQLK